MKFKDEKQMLEVIDNGVDLYCEEKELYAFQYNEDGAICTYSLDADEAKKVAKMATEIDEYWGAVLGAGGNIYDDPAAFCKDTFEYEWVYTDEWEIKNGIYRDTDSVYHSWYLGCLKKLVMADYNANSVELNGLYFDMTVRATKSELLRVYKELQYMINGDYVVYLKGVKLKDGMISGLIIDAPEEDDSIYEGNFKDFLESYNKETSDGWNRVFRPIISGPELFLVGEPLNFVA